MGFSTTVCAFDAHYGGVTESVRNVLWHISIEAKGHCGTLFETEEIA
jgi:hypothetical protein